MGNHRAFFLLTQIFLILFNLKEFFPTRGVPRAAQFLAHFPVFAGARCGKF